MLDDRTRILVLCTGNSCRSQMAEGFFRRRLRELGLSKAAGTVRSAGVETHGLNPKAVEVMAEVGIDISHHRSTNLKDYLDDEFDYIITVCDNAAERCPVFPGGGLRLHWPFQDPARATGTDAEIMDVFRKVRNQIREKIRTWLDEMITIKKRP